MQMIYAQPLDLCYNKYRCDGGIGEVWLTHRIVVPARVGSSPTYRPINLKN